MASSDDDKPLMKPSDGGEFLSTLSASHTLDVDSQAAIAFSTSPYIISPL
jgi:hypothetical protein